MKGKKIELKIKETPLDLLVLNIQRGDIKTSEEFRRYWEFFQGKDTVVIDTLVQDKQLKEDKGIDYFGTLLHYAVAAGSVSVVQALLDLGADHNQADKADFRGRFFPLRLALGSPDFECKEENLFFKIATLLVGKGVNVNAPSIYGSRGKADIQSAHLALAPPSSEPGAAEEAEEAEVKGDDDATRPSFTGTFADADKDAVNVHPALLRFYIEWEPAIGWDPVAKQSKSLPPEELDTAYRKAQERAMFLIQNNAELNPVIPLDRIRMELAGQTHVYQNPDDIISGHVKIHYPHLCLTAFERGQYPVVAEMLKKDVSLVNLVYPEKHKFNGETMLDRAIIDNNPRAVGVLLNGGADPQSGLIRLLLSRQCDEKTLKIARYLILCHVKTGVKLPNKYSVTDISNKRLAGEINKFLKVAGCLTSAFGYAKGVDAKFDAQLNPENLSGWRGEKELINGAFNNARVTDILGRVAPIKDGDDTTVRAGSRAKYSAVFKAALPAAPVGSHNIFPENINDKAVVLAALSGLDIEGGNHPYAQQVAR
ncbi:MAG: hypothetical protein KAT71_02710, partial [Gammaproteobacteria bacterium]|nr:hypothetical protein [Gammaproteobacteria bacterium]